MAYNKNLWVGTWNTSRQDKKWQCEKHEVKICSDVWKRRIILVEEVFMYLTMSIGVMSNYYKIHTFGR